MRIYKVHVTETIVRETSLDNIAARTFQEACQVAQGMLVNTDLGWARSIHFEQVLDEPEPDYLEN